MKYIVWLKIFLLVLYLSFSWAPTSAAAQETKTKTCRMEQQCRWENFKRICTYVKVCR
jgi:hypothetical protein